LKNFNRKVKRIVKGVKSFVLLNYSPSPSSKLQRGKKSSTYKGDTQMKRIAVLIAVLLVISCVPMYAQQDRPVLSSQQSQHLNPAVPSPSSEEFAYLSPDEGSMDMFMPEGEDMPQQGIEEAGIPPHSQGHDGVAVLPQMLGKLKLTDTQKKDVEKIVFDAAKETIAQKAKVATARLELRQLLKADSPDKNTIEKKINEIADLSAQIHVDHVDGWFAINKLLTPDQQKIWKHALAARPQMGHGKFAKHFSGEGREFPQDHRHAPADKDTPAPPQQ